MTWDMRRMSDIPVRSVELAGRAVLGPRMEVSHSRQDIPGDNHHGYWGLCSEGVDR